MFGMSHISRLVSFLPGGSVASGVGILSCLGLGFGSAFFLPPTLAVGVSCSLGYFGLFSHAILNQLLQKTTKIDKTTTEHRQEFNQYVDQFNLHTQQVSTNFQTTSVKLTKLQDDLTSFSDRTQDQHKDNAGKFVALQLQNDAMKASIDNVDKRLEDVGIDVKIVQNNLQQLSENTDNLLQQVTSEGEKAQKRDVVTNERLHSFGVQLDLIGKNSQKNHAQITTTANQILDEQEELKKKQLAINQALQTNEEMLKKVASSQDQTNSNVAYLVRVKEEEIRKGEEKRQIHTYPPKQSYSKKTSSSNIQEMFNQFLPQGTHLDGQMNSGNRGNNNLSYPWQQ